MEALAWALFGVSLIWAVIATCCAAINRATIERLEARREDLVEEVRKAEARKDFAERELKIARSEAGDEVRAIQNDVTAAFQYLDSAKRMIREREGR